MATNMEKVTKVLRQFGVININDLADIAKVDRRAIYGLAKQGNATFTVANGAVVLKDVYKVIEDTKEDKVEVRCKKHHVPEHLILMNGKSLLEVEQKFTLDLYLETLDELRERGDDPNPTTLRGAMALINKFLIKINKELEEENK